MSQISILETEIRECQEKIRELKQEQEKLEEVKQQNDGIASNMQQHISSRRNHAAKLYQFNHRTTISKLIAGRIEESYSRSEETKLLGNYDEIRRELQNAIKMIEEEIEEQNVAIRAKQKQIDTIREQARKEQERKAMEQR